MLQNRMNQYFTVSSSQQKTAQAILLNLLLTAAIATATTSSEAVKNTHKVHTHPRLPPAGSPPPAAQDSIKEF